MEKILGVGVKKWALTDIEKIYALENRAVYSAKSKKYGAVILKINQNINCIFSEYQMLKAMSGNHCCRVYEFEAENGMFLEEKLLPGTALRSEAGVDIRIARFAEVFQKIHYAPSSEFEYFTYFDWLERAYSKMQTVEKARCLTHEITIARDICAKMFEKYPDRMLLHGDLHHDNILLTLDGSYSIIDPKGVVGPNVFDIPRFIMNELDPDLNKSGKAHVSHVIEEVSNLLGYSAEDVRELFFMEVILGNCWRAEDGEALDMNGIEIAAELYHKKGQNYCNCIN